MSLVKRTNWPSLMNGNWLSDFFDNDRFFDSDLLKSQTLPAVNIKEADKNYEIELAAPGLSKKDFKITAENGVLTISSERSEQTEKKEKDYTRKEFNFSSFSRSFMLPENADENDVKANYQDGVLRLQVAKKELAPSRSPKAIDVQ